LSEDVGCVLQTTLSLLIHFLDLLLSVQEVPLD
jgi:hypothetical protein